MTSYKLTVVRSRVKRLCILSRCRVDVVWSFSVVFFFAIQSLLRIVHFDLMNKGHWNKKDWQHWMVQPPVCFTVKIFHCWTVVQSLRCCLNPSSSGSFVPFHPLGSSHHGNATRQPLKGWLSFGIVWRSCLDCIFDESFCYDFWVWAQLVQDGALFFSVAGTWTSVLTSKSLSSFCMCSNRQQRVLTCPWANSCFPALSRKNVWKRQTSSYQSRIRRTGSNNAFAIDSATALTEQALFGASRDYINLWLFDYTPFNVVQLHGLGWWTPGLSNVLAY